MKVNAVILAAGLGRRLRPLTLLAPKPLLPLENKLILLRIVEWLLNNNIQNIYVITAYLNIITYHYLKHICKAYPQLKIITDDKLRGTAGQLYNVRDEFEDNDIVVIVNCDVITNLKLKEIINYHLTKNAELTIITKTLDYELRLGVIESDLNSEVIKWLEKPKVRVEVVAGIYITNGSILKTLSSDYLDMNEWVNNLLVVKGYRVFKCSVSDEVVDIGSLNDYLKFLEYGKEKRNNYLNLE